MKTIWKSIAAILLLCLAICGALLLKHTASGWQLTEEKEETGDKQTAETQVDTEQLDYYGLEPFETTLPVVYIDTGGGRITKENKIWASLGVLEADSQGRSILEQPDKEFAITIKYRGASSYSQFDKKQYRIKFYKKQGSSKELESEFLGMGSDSEWVLNGPFLDKTLLRNRLVYNLGREIFEWAPDSRYVELFLDGEYQGVYLAVEPITNGASRLRLSKFGLLSGETAYIIKRDRVDTESSPLQVYGKLAGKTSNDLYVSYPSAKNLTAQQEEWITADISAFEQALYGENFADPDSGYPAYIDVDCFVDYYIFNEFFMNEDAGNLSTYAYKELGGKLMLAIWDYNNCLDNYQWFYQDTDEFIIKENSWFSRLLEDDNFVAKVVERYRELRRGVLSTDYIESKIADYQNELGDAIERNFAVWGYTFESELLYDSDDREYRNPQSYEEAILQLTVTLEKRAAFLDEHIEDLYNSEGE